MLFYIIKVLTKSKKVAVFLLLGERGRHMACSITVISPIKTQHVVVLSSPASYRVVYLQDTHIDKHFPQKMMKKKTHTQL